MQQQVETLTSQIHNDLIASAADSYSYSITCEEKLLHCGNKKNPTSLIITAGGGTAAAWIREISAPVLYSFCWCGHTKTPVWEMGRFKGQIMP